MVTAPDAIHFKANDFDLSVSQAALDSVLASMTSHPVVLGLVLVFLMFWIVQSRAGRRERAIDKLEYQRLRHTISKAGQMQELDEADQVKDKRE